MRPDAGEQRFLAVSLLYTEVPQNERVPPSLLSVQVVARRLGVSPGTVYSLCGTGQLPHTRVLNAIRIVESDLDDYISRHR